MIRPYKGLEDLIAAFQSISNPGVRLLIAGEPLTPKYGRKLASTVAEDHRIQLIPRFISSDEIQLFMNACDAVVFPYRKIFTSGAVLLAMSFGKACIATNTGSLGEILGQAGSIFCSPHDPDSLRTALLEAIEAKSELGNMGRRNYAQAKQWSWEAMAQRTAELYRSCLHPCPESRPINFENHHKENTNGLRNNQRRPVAELL